MYTLINNTVYNVKQKNISFLFYFWVGIIDDDDDGDDGRYDLRTQVSNMIGYLKSQIFEGISYSAKEIAKILKSLTKHNRTMMMTMTTTLFFNFSFCFMFQFNDIKYALDGNIEAR